MYGLIICARKMVHGAGIDRVKIVSDYKDREFGNNYNIYINELGLLSRTVFVVYENNKVVYMEYLDEITYEIDYKKDLEVLK